MTSAELEIAKALYDKVVKIIESDVERSAMVNKVRDINNGRMADLPDSSDDIQYQAFLTDPRRI